MTRWYSAESSAPPQALWALVAEPSRWSQWSPHLRGAWGLGDPEVQLGRRGAARLLGVVPVPAVIVAKTPGRSWSWRVGPMTLIHSVAVRPGGSRITMGISAPGPLEAVLAASYGPVVQVLARRLARVAEDGA